MAFTNRICMPFPFNGTLVYFEVDISKTETEEIIDNFNF